jgi:hypothetical protein
VFSLYGSHIYWSSFFRLIFGYIATSGGFTEVGPAVEGGGRGLVTRRFRSVLPAYGYAGQRLDDFCAFG